MEIKIGDRY